MSAIIPIVSNIFASVGIILVNKQIVSSCGFQFLLTLLFLNFLTTGSTTAALAHFGYFEVQHVPTKDRWLIALLAMMTVLLNNASNEANSVGFYQITKLLIIPTVIFIERAQGIRRTYSSGIKCSLFVASCGVALATVSDFEVNVRGSILACVSILLTAQYQIWQGSKQKEHGLTPMQITHSVAWPQSVLGCLATSVFDVFMPSLKEKLLLPPGGLFQHRLRGKEDFGWICLCCMLAVAMNLSTYGLIGKTSPVTYQVIGQLKTCLIVGFGYLLFDATGPAHWIAMRFTGVAIAVVGIISYAAIKNEEQKASASGDKDKSS